MYEKALSVMLIALPLILSLAHPQIPRRTILRSAAAAPGWHFLGEIRPTIAMTPPRRVLVAGATGRTGQRVVERLFATGGALEPIAGVRSSNGKATSKLPKDIAVLTGLDLADDALTTTSCLRDEMMRLGVTDVICTIGFSPTMLGDKDKQLAQAVDYLGTSKLMAAAQAAGLSGRFVLVSSLGVNALGESSSARLLDSSLGNVLVQKKKTESALRSTDLDWCIVRPGLLLKDASQGGVLLGPEDRWTGSAERDGAGLGPPVSCQSPFLLSSGAVCAATRAQVAEVCVQALTGDPDIFSRRVVEVVTRPDVREPFRVVGQAPPALSRS